MKHPEEVSIVFCVFDFVQNTIRGTFFFKNAVFLSSFFFERTTCYEARYLKYKRLSFTLIRIQFIVL